MEAKKKLKRILSEMVFHTEMRDLIEFKRLDSEFMKVLEQDSGEIGEDYQNCRNSCCNGLGMLPESITGYSACLSNAREYLKKAMLN